MLVKQESINVDATDTLLGRICDILFTNVKRYVRMKKLYVKDEKSKPERMFAAQVAESDQSDQVKFPNDIANYINQRGGKQVVFGRIKMNASLNFRKVVLFIQKIDQAGQIDPNSEFAK